MNTKPQLVLDIAGVLIDNLSVEFWQELAVLGGTTFPLLKARLEDIRKDLWTGRMKEEQFWQWLNERYPSIRKATGYELLLRTMNELPAFGLLERWSRLADIHLLSNHCREWLEPMLVDAERYATSITISNQVGVCKPEPRIYEIVQQLMPNNSFVLYVDDQEKNFAPAKQLGWITLRADEQHRWIEQVEPILIGNLRITI